MGAISATDIISIIQSEIENFDFDTESRETGEVIYVGDGIATIYDLTIHGMLNAIDGRNSVSYPDDRADFLLTGHHIIIFYLCFQYGDNLL